MARSREPKALPAPDRLRFTPQRLAVLDAIRRARGNPDAVEMYQITRRKLPRTSPGTIVDLELSELDTLGEQAQRASGFTRLVDDRLEFNGVCRNDAS